MTEASATQRPNENREMHVFESSGITHVEVIRTKYKWTINNFSCSSKKFGEALHSPIFSGGIGANKIKWRLALYPQGLHESKLSILLRLMSFNANEVKAKYKYSILTAKGEESNTVVNSGIFTVKRSWSCTMGITHNVLLTKKNIFLPNDKLTIICNIIANIGDVTFSAQSITLRNYLEKDFASLLANPEYSDFIISVGGKEFKAHKAILAARSPVFKSMFSSNMKESKTNRVEIEESDAVVSEMLNYIYTEKASTELAPELLPLADRYLLEGLKLMCEKALCESLSVENSVQFFILGHMYGAEQLKVQAKDFILTHASNLVKTEEFTSMLREYPNLGAEVFAAIVD